MSAMSASLSTTQTRPKTKTKIERLKPACESIHQHLDYTAQQIADDWTSDTDIIEYRMHVSDTLPLAYHATCTVCGLAAFDPSPLLPPYGISALTLILGVEARTTRAKQYIEFEKHAVFCDLCKRSLAIKLQFIQAAISAARGDWQQAALQYETLLSTKFQAQILALSGYRVHAFATLWARLHHARAHNPLAIACSRMSLALLLYTTILPMSSTAALEITTKAETEEADACLQLTHCTLCASEARDFVPEFILQPDDKQPGQAAIRCGPAMTKSSARALPSDVKGGHQDKWVVSMLRVQPAFIGARHIRLCTQCTDAVQDLLINRPMSSILRTARQASRLQQLQTIMYTLMHSQTRLGALTFNNFLNLLMTLI